LFLERLANLDTSNSRRVGVFIETFSDLLPAYGTRPNPRPDVVVNTDINLSILDPHRFFWSDAQPSIQALWREPAPQLKESGLLMLAGKYMYVGALFEVERQVGIGHGLGTVAKMTNDQRGSLSPRVDRFLMVLLHALKNVHLLRYCANPKCKEPYFVARRGSQIYCSSPCAEPAQREAKLKWWREHGEDRRRKLKKKRGAKHAKAT
jgi:hypothetical protein